MHEGYMTVCSLVVDDFYLLGTADRLGVSRRTGDWRSQIGGVHLTDDLRVHLTCITEVIRMGYQRYMSSSQSVNSQDMSSGA